MTIRAALGLVPAFVLVGCAFFGKSEPLDARYYSAERSLDAAAAGSVRPPSLTPLDPARAVPLRLGEVSGATHLRERVAYRSGARELGFYELRRWTERPEAYLRRALAHALFEQRGMLRVSSGAAPTLEVELTHFEEVLAPRHAVRVQAHVLLREHRTARFEHTFGAEQAVEGSDFGDVPEALATALAHVVDEISDRVIAELRARPAVSDPYARPPVAGPTIPTE